jgi:MFS family permease
VEIVGGPARPRRATPGSRLSRILPEDRAQRALIPATFVNFLGNGLFNSAAVLYFTLVVHLSATQVGLGLTTAGIVGLAGGIPVGTLADRRGPRAITAVTFGIQALSMTAFLAIHNVLAFTLVACVDRLAASANNAARGGLIARVGGANPATFRFKLRSFSNAGVVFGTLGSGIAVEVGTHTAYSALILANALSDVGAALCVLRIPSYPPIPKPKQHEGGSVLADRPFVTFAAIDGAMGLQYGVISLLLPLWIAFHTRAPHWTVAAAFAMNAVIAVILQARIGTNVNSTHEGGRAFRRAGLFFLVSCPALALAADVPGNLAPLIVLGAICVHSLGEIWQSCASIALGFGLAPEHAQGQYQGALGLGFDAGQALAPALLSTAVLGLGQAGWILLGVFFGALGSLGPPVTAWARRTPPRVPAD